MSTFKVEKCFNIVLWFLVRTFSEKNRHSREKIRKLLEISLKWVISDRDEISKENAFFSLEKNQIGYVRSQDNDEQMKSNQTKSKYNKGLCSIDDDTHLKERKN